MAAVPRSAGRRATADSRHEADAAAAAEADVKLYEAATCDRHAGATGDGPRLDVATSGGRVAQSFQEHFCRLWFGILFILCVGICRCFGDVLLI